MGILDRLRGKKRTEDAVGEVDVSSKKQTSGAQDKNTPAQAAVAKGTSITGTSAVTTGASRKGVYDFSKLDEAMAEVSTEKTDAGEEALDVSKLTRKEKKALRDAMEGSINSYPHLMAMKPSEGYLFRSDYFNVDNYVGAVLAFFHDDSAEDGYPEFWGINQIPSGLDSTVTVVLLESVARMPETWVENNMKTVDRLDKLEETEQESGGTMQSRRRTAKIAMDMRQVTAELQNGASYLSVHMRLLVKAPDLDTLERNIERIRRLYVERFGTLSVAAYPGEQRAELSNLLAPNRVKRGKGFHFTSNEYAGSYSLVTNGLNDPTGEYVGYMVGDVNNSAVLFDVDDYRERVVCADSTISTAPALNRPRVVDMWGSKIGQSALINNRRVVHLVLNDAKLDQLGPKLSQITSKVDMVSGDINMFEFFGDVDDELSLYSAQVEKITLMAEQAQPPTDADRSIIRGELSHLLERFYTDMGMWSPNAKENRDRLRLVGLPHEDVPRLHNFYTYLENEYKSLVNKDTKDESQVHAANVLRLIFKAMLENNGDLFNEPTSNSIDGVDGSRRVIYDFANLRMRGQGVAMAQLVNVIGFAVRNLNDGDVLVIHGAERIERGVQDYLEMQIDGMIQRGGRVVYLYNSVTKMLDESAFNQFVRADYTILGPMTPDIVPEYQAKMNQTIPDDLQRLVTASGRNQSYLRRKFANVVFYTDLGLGLSSSTKSRDSTGGASPGTDTSSESEVDSQTGPVATSAGTKVDEAVTEDGGAQLAEDVEAAVSRDAAREQTQAAQEEMDEKSNVDFDDLLARRGGSYRGDNGHQQRRHGIMGDAGLGSEGPQKIHRKFTPGR